MQMTAARSFAAAQPVRTPLPTVPLFGTELVSATPEAVTADLLAHGAQRRVAFLNAHCANVLARDPIHAAAAQVEMVRHDFGEPRIRLIDQTGLIRIEMTGYSAEDARARARALLAAFTAEVDALRRDEIGQRETGGAEAIDAYRAAVGRVRARISALQRDHAVAEAVFASALARADTSRTDLFVSYPLVQVLEDPSLPDHPSSPRHKLAVAVGGAGSLCLLIGLGMGWLRRPLIDRLLVRPA